ncbi:prolyl oligopeptidase family serine peptidase [Moraxella canis]|uniref:prolyl oligopeptidase n=1 Tax=Moraxella canis TaxID=90239 RepID=A0ABZ0WZJ7_9GAMM|nr:prolyl oligopeptidase family serine peptidase [Moraxella canis]WQE04678.1 prolyl oligopeptidase family serine peptidase [Moraxella canis]
MKLKKLVLLIALASGVYSAHAMAQDTNATAATNQLIYPTTRVHQQQQDHFLYGEYGRPSNYVSASGGVLDTSERPRPDDGVDHYFDETVVDKYRWLEEIDVISPEYAKETSADRDRNYIGTRLENEVPDDQFDNRTLKALQTVGEKTSSEVNDWVNAQNAVTQAYLNSIPYYDQIRQNIDGLMDFEHQIRKSKFDQLGELYLYRGVDGYTRLRYTDLSGNQRIIFDEKTLSEDGRVVIADGDMHPSKDGTYVALIMREGDTDTDKYYIQVLDSRTGDMVGQRINHINASSMSIFWADDTKFYYATTNGGWPEVHLRDVTQPRFNDKIEVARSHLTSWIGDIWLEGDDNRYMVIEHTTPVDNFYIKDLQTGRYYRIHNQKHYNKKYHKADSFTAGFLARYVHFDPKTLDVMFISEENNPKGEILKINLKTPNRREVVVNAPSNYDEILSAVWHDEGDGYFLIKYSKDGTHRLVLTDARGNFLEDISPSDAGNADDLRSVVAGKDTSHGDKEALDSLEVQDNYVSFRYFSTITPRTIYKYSPTKREFIDIRRRDLHPFVSENYETKNITYTSKDGTKIPMVISHKKGLVLDGKNPTVLYGYGGFGVPSDNAFRFDRAVWLEHGGVWATAHLRGGSELGEEWHQAGKRLNKMNVFDDFEAAADYLIDKNYTSSDYLAISGASNGGLLVGAAMTLNPNKYRVALPEVGVLDMLRHADNYHTQYWVAEYGTPFDSRAMYDMLRGYSPYHNVKAGVCYPSTIVMTSKRDDRVTPSHSYKFAAALQEHQACDNPTLLHAAEIHGHGARIWVDRKDNYQIVTAFRLHEMGITNIPTNIYRPTPEELKGEKWLAEEAQESAETLRKQQQYRQNLENQ